MLKGVLAVGLLMVLTGLALRGWGYFVRHRALKVLPAASRVRSAHGVSLRIHDQGARLPGMAPGANRTRGDLALTDERLMVVCNRGVVVDLRLGSQGLTSARCPGPGKLVLEGEISRPTRGPGFFRIEAMLDDAPGWAEAVQVHVREETRGRYGSLVAGVGSLEPTRS